MKIYTRTGDKGSTALFGGRRVPKHDLRIEAYGTVDELNSHIGITLTHDLPEKLRSELTELSALLFSLGSDLATPLSPPPKYAIPRMAAEHSSWLEACIDKAESSLEPLKSFILPGGCPAAAQLHLARTVCRRAERGVTELAEAKEINLDAQIFLNRLSDYLFVAARFANHHAGIEDSPWVNPAI